MPSGRSNRAQPKPSTRTVCPPPMTRVRPRKMASVPRVVMRALIRKTVTLTPLMTPTRSAPPSRDQDGDLDRQTHRELTRTGGRRKDRQQHAGEAGDRADRKIELRRDQQERGGRRDHPDHRALLQDDDDVLVVEEERRRDREEDEEHDQNDEQRSGLRDGDTRPLGRPARPAARPPLRTLPIRSSEASGAARPGSWPRSSSATSSLQLRTAVRSS